MYSISSTTCYPQPSVGIAYGKCGMTETVQVNLYIAPPSATSTQSRRSVWPVQYGSVIATRATPAISTDRGGWEQWFQYLPLFIL